MHVLQRGDRLVVSELSRLGRSLGQIVAILDALAKAGVAFVAMKENIRVEGQRDIQAKVMTTLFALFAEVERAREGLAQARSSGSKLGRPKGSLGVSRLNGKEDDIRRFLELGVSKTAIAKLTGEPDYKSLSIDESYGLTVVHKDGSTIPVRSAGAEHIVALSLMGALQRNAPLRGPIVMDLPFGRLDEVHTAKVVQALPSMADEALLLVYESELDPKQARNHLEGRLRKEYRIARRTARHSELEAMSQG